MLLFFLFFFFLSFKQSAGSLEEPDRFRKARQFLIIKLKKCLIRHFAENGFKLF